MGVSLGVDLSDLDVCFGGFSPTAMKDATQSVERARQAEERLKARQEALDRADQVERARASEPREWRSPEGSLWRYVLLDGSEVRIERCLEASASLSIPPEIEGLPVVALANDACAHLEEAERIHLPGTVVSIGLCAFRECESLRRIEFPAGLARFDSDWLRGCRRLEELRLPGQLDKLTPAMFDAPNLKVLEVGAGTSAVLPGAFAKSSLRKISVDAGNQSLWTDGIALYTQGKETLLALAVPVERYDVVPACRAIAKKGLSGFSELRSVGLPDELQIVGDFAYAKTGVSSFVAPPGLRAIGERAFFDCASLREVLLNEGLTSIGSNAFTATPIEQLRMPSTIEELGCPVAARTSLTYAGPTATFGIAEGSTHLMLDSAGVLYQLGEDGLRLVRMMDPDAEECIVDARCTVIGEEAFQRHERLERVVLPEGLRIIEARAFRGCRKLVSADLPSTVAELGEEAFLDTNLRKLRVPGQLARIGSSALVTEGAHRGSIEPALRDVTVDAANERFRMESGLLVEHLDAGYDRVVLCTGAVPDVVVPDTVKAIAPYAFSGVRTLRTLSISDRITMVEVRGLAFDSMVERIHLELEEPIEGHATIDLEFPATTRAAQQMMLAFSVPPFVNVAEILAHYDNSILNASGFDIETEEGLPPYDQVTRILERLSDPILMTPANRNSAEKVMRSHLGEFCVALARHDDKQGFEAMMDLGFLDADTIADAIGWVAPLQDASITNFLLEAKQRRFGQAAIDFESDFEL